MLRQPKQLGAKVHTCPIMSSMMDVSMMDVVGAETFLQQAAHGQALSSEGHL